MRVGLLAVVGLMMTPWAIGQDASPWAPKLFRTEDGKIPIGHDFGTVPRGALLRHRFPITNIYAVPLQITPNPLCNCVTATANPPLLQPKETGFLDVTMDTMRFNGPKRVELLVTAASQNQQFASTAMLVITGNCRLDVTLFPAQAEFGTVPRGQSPTKDLRVSYAGNANWKIDGAAPSESTPFDVRLQEESRGKGQVNYRVQLALKADASPGIYRGELNLVTNDPLNRQIPIPYDVTVQAPLTVTPDVARFGNVKVNEAATPRKLFVRGTGRPFRIVEVAGQDDGLSVEIPADALAVQILTLKFQPTKPGPVARTLTIKTDSGETATVKVEAVVAGQ
jgi:hypothetical protein